MREPHDGEVESLQALVTSTDACDADHISSCKDLCLELAH
jgi:hypothetical protein